MDNPHQRVKFLSEALPYIQKFRDKVIVVKYGGSAMTDDALKQKFARDIVLLKAVGMHPVVVHGGGPHISKNLEQAGIEARFVNGLRITCAETMKVVERTLSEVNRGIVAGINAAGGEALGVTDHMIRARKLPPVEENGEMVDLGYVGEVVGIVPELRDIVVHETRVAVISPVAKGSDGGSYNVNGDIAASNVAISLGAEKLIMLTDIVGLLNERGNLISEASRNEVAAMIDNGVIHGGMLPKVRCMFDSVDQGVRLAHIIDGRVEHALLLELLTDEGVGTLIHNNHAT